MSSSAGVSSPKEQQGTARSAAAGVKVPSAPAAVDSPDLVDEPSPIATAAAGAGAASSSSAAVTKTVLPDPSKARASTRRAGRKTDDKSSAGPANQSTRGRKAKSGAVVPSKSDGVPVRARRVSAEHATPASSAAWSNGVSALQDAQKAVFENQESSLRLRFSASGEESLPGGVASITRKSAKAAGRRTSAKGAAEQKAAAKSRTKDHVAVAKKKASTAGRAAGGSGRKISGVGVGAKQDSFSVGTGEQDNHDDVEMTIETEQNGGTTSGGEPIFSRVDRSPKAKQNIDQESPEGQDVLDPDEEDPSGPSRSDEDSQHRGSSDADFECSDQDDDQSDFSRGSSGSRRASSSEDHGERGGLLKRHPPPSRSRRSSSRSFGEDSDSDEGDHSYQSSEGSSGDSDDSWDSRSSRGSRLRDGKSSADEEGSLLGDEEVALEELGGRRAARGSFSRPSRPGDLTPESVLSEGELADPERDAVEAREPPGEFVELPDAANLPGGCFEDPLVRPGSSSTGNMPDRPQHSWRLRKTGWLVDFSDEVKQVERTLGASMDLKAMDQAAASRALWGQTTGGQTGGFRGASRLEKKTAELEARLGLDDWLMSDGERADSDDDDYDEDFIDDREKPYNLGEDGTVTELGILYPILPVPSSQ